jgi:nicotinamidase-related amidase
LVGVTVSTLDPARTALLAMDLQVGIVSRYTADRPDFMTRVAGVLKWARATGIRVVHVRVGFRPGLPEVGARNPLFAAVKQSPQHQKLFEGALGEIHPDAAPAPGEVVIVKSRVSAFAGTDLDLVLRTHDTDTLILCGIATSGVVLSTALHASDADYRLFVVEDCCADTAPELHASLLARLYPRRGTVISSADLIAGAALSSGA